MVGSTDFSNITQTGSSSLCIHSFRSLITSSYGIPWTNFTRSTNWEKKYQQILKHFPSKRSSLYWHSYLFERCNPHKYVHQRKYHTENQEITTSALQIANCKGKKEKSFTLTRFLVPICSTLCTNWSNEKYGNKRECHSAYKPSRFPRSLTCRHKLA